MPIMAQYTITFNVWDKFDDDEKQDWDVDRDELNDAWNVAESVEDCMITIQVYIEKLEKGASKEDKALRNKRNAENRQAVTGKVETLRRKGLYFKKLVGSRARYDFTD